MRVLKSIKNIKTGVFNQVIVLVLNFFVRSIFILKIGNLYLGINGLLLNIVSIFSLAELGISEAINFKLYKLIAENEEKEIVKVMNFYKEIYRKIAILIFGIGIIFMFYLESFIPETQGVKNIYVIYFLFLLNSIFSYFNIYKSALLIADQKSYIINNINLKIVLANAIFQIISIFIFKSYILYLVIQIITTVVKNILISQKCDNEYSILGLHSNEKISEKMKKNIFKDVKNLLVYKIGSISLNATDNIIIAKFIDIASIGVYSNYSLIFTSISSLINIVFNSVIASIGNLVAEKDKEKSYFIFNVLNFVLFFVYSTVGVILYGTINDFMKIWLGENFIFDKEIILVLIINFYISGLLFAAYAYRQTAGLFKYGKWRPIISSIINLVLSVVLIRSIGIVGVFIATIATRLITNVWYDPYILFTHYFEKNFTDYLKKMIKNMSLFLIYLIIYESLGKQIVVNNIFELLVKGMIILLGITSLNILIFYKTEEFIYLRKILKEKIWGRI